MLLENFLGMSISISTSHCRVSPAHFVNWNLNLTEFFVYHSKKNNFIIIDVYVNNLNVLFVKETQLSVCSTFDPQCRIFILIRLIR